MTTEREIRLAMLWVATMIAVASAVVTAAVILAVVWWLR